jgi:sRNA-binding carbon storage regulator CsrA
MALNLTVRMHSSVYVNDRPLTVVAVEGDNQVVVRTDDGRLVMLTNDRTVEVYPEVYIGVGLITEEYGGTRLTFEAPKHITILREKHYKANAQASKTCASA